MKKHLFLRTLLACVLCLLLTASGAQAAEPSYGELIRFIPTYITVDETSVTVEGYFANLNESVAVSDFHNFSMQVFTGSDLLVEGDFGEINSFTVQPLGLFYQSFTFNGEHDLNVGEYVCSDDFYTVVTCEFYYSDD